MSNIEKITIEESKKLVEENEKTHYLCHGFDIKYTLFHKGEYFFKTKLNDGLVYYVSSRGLREVLK